MVNGRGYIDKIRTIGRIYLESDVGYVLEISRKDFTHIPLDDRIISWNQLENSTIVGSNISLKFYGQFSSRLLSFGAIRNLSSFNYPDFKGFYVRYSGSNEKGAPVIRIQLGLENGTLLEIQHFMMQTTETNTYYSDIGETYAITSIVMSLDSGTENLY